MNICMEIWVYGIWVWFCMELVKFRMELVKFRMELVKFRMEKYRSLYNSMGLSSFGCRKYKHVVWRLPISFLVRVELRKVLRIL